MKLTFVTSNNDKVKEARSILNLPVQSEDLDLNELQSISVSEVVDKKVKEAHSVLNGNLFTEDIGVYIDDLNRFPGALVKWIDRTFGYNKLCEMVEDNRSATVRAAIGLYWEGEVKTFLGEVEGSIAKEPRGESGFGFDFVFIPEGYDRTFAELGKEVKNKISMRKRALEKMSNYIKNKK